MKDVQKQKPHHSIKIAQVGVKDIAYPIIFEDGSDKVSTVGKFTLSVELNPEEKGTHMSRFSQAIYDHASILSKDILKTFTQDLLVRLHTSKATVKVSFRYFYETFAPVSKIKGLADCFVSVSTSAFKDGSTSQILSLKVPVKSLCPCSKEISKYGAHAQRSYILAKIKNPTHPLKTYIECLESSGSARLYPLLKREDEKFVTEQAYENPKFVEDIIREAAFKMSKLESSFQIFTENFESIHHHNVWAKLNSKDFL